MNEVKKFLMADDAVSTVEIILIVVVLIALVVVFRDQITSVVNNILSKVANQSNAV